METKQNNKLEGWVDKVRWMGIDKKSENAYQVYWPSKQIVTVEHNVYWKPLECGIKEEEEGMHLSNATLTYINDSQPHATATATAKSNLSLPQPQATINAKATATLPVPGPITTSCPKHTHQPSQHVLDIINGKALDPTPPQGIQLPDPVAENPKPDGSLAVFEGEGMANQMLATAAYNDDNELVLELNETIAEAEALEPTSLTKAKWCSDWLQWEHGICKELAMLKKASTWDLIESPVGTNIIGSKWIFCTKKDAAGNVVRHKACLVMQGFL